MKRSLIVFFSILLVLSFVLCACSSPTSTPASTPAPATAATTTSAAPSSAPTVATPAKVITLKYAEANAKGGWYGTHSMLPWIESMEKATKGQIKIDVYENETLLKSPAIWNGVITGVADIGWCVNVVMPGKFPVGDIMTLPLLPFKSAEHSTTVFWMLYQKYPALRDEFKDVHVLEISPSEPYFLLNTKREVKTMDDLKGLKLRVSAGPQAEMMQSIGASPISMGMGDVYLNLQKGVLDGLATPWEAVYSWKFYEVAKYYTYVPLLCNNAYRIMNTKVWDSLSPDLQKAIDSVNGAEGSKIWGRTQFDDLTAVARSEVKNKGYAMQEYTLPADELTKWQNTAAKPIWDKWVSNMKNAGHPEAQDMLNDLLAFAKQTTP
jgi:TRAP-type transport system periplasmic protein